jgi:hypothetical protein
MSRPYAFAACVCITLAWLALLLPRWHPLDDPEPDCPDELDPDCERAA